jgi:cell division protein FtsB
MMERAYLNGYRTRQAIYRGEGTAAVEQGVNRRPPKVKWRFKPRAFGLLVIWGLLFFVVGRIVVVPLIEGVWRYYAKTKELAQLQQRSQALGQQRVALEKTRNYMQTHAYVEEKGHQLGMIKQNETQMVVVDPKELQLKETRAKKAREEIYQD